MKKKYTWIHIINKVKNIVQNTFYAHITHVLTIFHE